MNTIKNFGVSDHHHWYGIMRQHPKISNGRCIRKEYKTYDRRRFSLQGCCPVAQQLAAETPQGFSTSCGWNKLSL